MRCQYSVQRWNEASESWRTLTIDWGTRERAVSYVWRQKTAHRVKDADGNVIASRRRNGGWWLA